MWLIWINAWILSGAQPWRQQKDCCVSSQCGETVNGCRQEGFTNCWCTGMLTYKHLWGLCRIRRRKYPASNASPTDNQRPEVSGPSWPQDRRASAAEDLTSRWWMDAFTLTPEPGSGEDQIVISGNWSCKHTANGGSQQVRSTVFACLSTQTQQLDHGLQHETLCERFSTTWSTTICKIPCRAITLSKRKSNKRPQNGESSGEATKRSRQSRYERFLERGATPGQLPRFGWNSKEDNHRSEGSALSWSKAPDERRR